MLRLKDRSKGVPDSYRYTHSESGFISTGVNWWDMWDSIVKHRAANGYPPITEADAEDQLCKQLGPNFCEQEQPGSFNFVNTRLKFRDIIEGAIAYAAFLLGNTVSQEEANRRARICSSCYFRVQPQGCGACVKIGQLITGNVANKKTPHDRHLVNKACAICSCPSQSLVWFPMPMLEKPEVDSPEKQASYPAFCWRKQNGENYLPTAE